MRTPLPKTNAALTEATFRALPYLLSWGVLAAAMIVGMHRMPLALYTPIDGEWAKWNVEAILHFGKVFAEGFAPGITDGMRCDVEGNVWCSMGWADPKEDGVRCYSPEGDLLGKIHIPETVANLTFGGLLRNRLYICGSTSLYACYVDTQGAMRP